MAQEVRTVMYDDEDDDNDDQSLSSEAGQKMQISQKPEAPKMQSPLKLEVQKMQSPLKLGDQIMQSLLELVVQKMQSPQKPAGQKMQCSQKPACQKMQSITGHQDARQLTILWGCDTRYWNWSRMQICGQCMEVAELINVCWLEIKGKYATKNLTQGMDYQVKFVVKLLNNFNINKPVTFTLTSNTPDGSYKRVHTENMMAMPRNQIISITVGEFQTPRYNCGSGEVKFSMMNTDPFWKRGMVVIKAMVVPKSM